MIPSPQGISTTGASSQAWWTLPMANVLALLSTNLEKGLSAQEAKDRLAQSGPNELVEHGKKGPWRILWQQFTSTMILVLIGAAVVALLLKDFPDAIAILAIVVLNAILGFAQEFKAEKALEALKRLAAPLVRVRRSGVINEIQAKNLVQGDIVLLEAGNKIPADGRLMEAFNLRIQEASLTGESEPVEKTSSPIEAENTPLAERFNMVFSGTTVTYGRGAFVVTETGMKTELGRIADLLQTVSSESSPLQKRIAWLGMYLAMAILVIISLILLIGFFRGEEMREVFLVGVAIAVAAIPEGLPAVMTITLALGAQRMLNRQALIRKLPAVETLGSVTVICTDKTGTLTENRMKLRILDVAGHTLDLTETLQRGHPVLPANDKGQPLALITHTLLLSAGALCNDATIERDDSGEFRALGDPTEAALVLAATHFNLDKKVLDSIFPRRSEIPFSSERKRMTTLHAFSSSSLMAEHQNIASFMTQLGSSYALFSKGGMDVLLPLCNRIWMENSIGFMTPALFTRIEESGAEMAKKGLRVLGITVREAKEDTAQQNQEQIEKDLIFVGLVGLMDPPRPEAKQAVATCKSAGIRSVMITGDHPLTALQIAKELGIAYPGFDSVMTGSELAKLSEAELEGVVESVSVYARVSPEHKLNIVNALQKKGHVVAMTGDGVNDAPALRKSDIGVAMGITGTDVSKEAADMVLMDDNFSTIVKAVEEGRTIYDNVRKFVKYIVTSNSAEVATMFATQLMGLPMPLTTLQILWMNLVTDGLPGLALGLEPTEKNAMKRPPFSPQESLFSRGMGQHIVIMGVVLAAAALSVGFYGWYTHNPAWGTMVFTTLTLSQLGQAMAIRSTTESIFKMGFSTNRLLLVAVISTFILQLILIYAKPAQDLFKTLPLSARDLLICLVASTFVFWAVEIEKWWLRRSSVETEQKDPGII